MPVFILPITGPARATPNPYFQQFSEAPHILVCGDLLCGNNNTQYVASSLAFHSMFISTLNL